MNFLKLAHSKIGCGYTWAAMGEILTPLKLQAMKLEYGAEHYKFQDYLGTVDASKWIGHQVFDCSGLVQYCLQQLGYISSIEKESAQMIYDNYCTPIYLEDIQPGDLVFLRPDGQEIDHIGIYQGRGMTIEAKGTRYGVIEGGVDCFNVFGHLIFDGIYKEATMNQDLDWKTIIERASSDSARWEKAIITAQNAAKADGDLGDLEIFNFLPQLIEKIGNNK